MLALLRCRQAGGKDLKLILKLVWYLNVDCLIYDFRSLNPDKIWGVSIILNMQVEQINMQTVVVAQDKEVLEALESWQVV